MLYDLMLSEFKNSPVLKQYATILQYWHKSLWEAFRASGLQHTKLHSRLKNRGCSVTPGTVRHWVRGAVMAPEDLNNVDYLCDELGIFIRKPEMRDAVKKSAKALRTIHRSFARIVNGLIRRGVGAEEELSLKDRSFLGKYGLEPEDLFEAVNLKSVHSVSKQISEVPGHLVGIVMGGERQ